MPSTFDLKPEEDVGGLELSGTCTVWESDPENTTCIINTSQNWGVTFDWTTSGAWAGSMSGKWTVWVCLEKMGPDEAPAVPSEDVDFHQDWRPYDYSHKVTIKAGDVSVGLYRLATALTMRGPTDIPTPLAMLGDGPLIQVYEVPA
jgi:hypothetical protein